ncbi:predicted protein [Sclerotinia sclerotiorum 1980 UF-70]|uniref:Uncharacterized protein n=1 Tax=Sclerotinia sclerotiorum (strain ATCC 18683 / 1980 / Ss-1) TaxID=665079 RepID=A7EMQ9_SCLS1|nr:predicted protein [Sclerotinia sclerotiorum 1980 UF-70]EDO04125.1 predicted protein [Sclerotinia sclerotiorum 1980 UF-70]
MAVRKGWIALTTLSYNDSTNTKNWFNNFLTRASSNIVHR